LASGEDQAFVWEAHRKRVPVSYVRAPIFTSARRYVTDGWGRATSERLWQNTKQALGEYLKLVKGRLFQ
jgi:hypothetical protein